MRRLNINTISSILFCFYIVAVALMCFIKPEKLPEAPGFLLGIPTDKIAHFMMFFPFPLLAYASINRKQTKLVHDVMILCCILITGTVVAISTEILQRATGYRSYDIMDFVADISGITFCCILILIYIIHKHSRKCSGNS